MKRQTIIDKIWEKHLVSQITDGPDVLYIDRAFIHEVTSPQAFEGIERRGVPVFRPGQITATVDHNVPTLNQHLPIEEPNSRFQVDTMVRNTAKHGIEYFGLGHANNGIVHVIGPELGFTQPGMTIVCGDSHTSTHGAFGAIAFGIGTSEIEMVLASQCIMQTQPKTMQIQVDGQLRKGVTAKDLILYIIASLTAGGGTGYFIEFTGSTFRNMSMEGRMTVCNMSIEMGSRGGLIAPDDVTFSYIKGRERAPKGAEFDKAVAEWKKLYSVEGAVFDKVHVFDAAKVPPMITYGTNPGMGMEITGTIPPATDDSFRKSLKYMGLNAGEQLLGKQIDYVFVGSCTNGRIEDFRMFAEVVKGRKKAADVIVWLVPGSRLVENQIREEGLDKIIREAGFEIRQPGCSACLSMNEDKVPAGKYCVATTNRNFEGRQGPGARTILASPYVAAVAAVTGKITEIEDFINV